MYAKCGVFDRAQQVVDELPLRDVISWNAIIAAHVQHGQGNEALGCFHRMRREGRSPNVNTYACILKACGILQEADIGEQMHGEIIGRGLLQNDVVLGSALVDMYAKCGVLAKAQNVLDELPVRNVISWSALIAGYCQRGQGQEALGCFQRMRSEDLSPDAITYACILKACGISQEIDVGKIIHDEIVRQGILEKDVVLGNALVNMYVKCGALAKARKVFDELTLRDVVSWNTLIAGHVQHGQGKEALGCFRRMGNEGLSPTAITYGCILKACGITQEADIGEQLHGQIISQGILDKNVVLGSALVKFGALAKAQNVLDELRVGNVVSWNALIAGYGQKGQAQEALGCFRRMRSEGFPPNAISYACLLKACGIRQEIDMGKKVHDEIASQGLLEKCVVLGNALIDMYMKCRALTKAQNVFDELPVRDLVSWSTLIVGYAQHGQGKEALSCFQRMQSEGVSPDAITYACILECGINQEANMDEQKHGDITSQRISEKGIMLGSDLANMYATCGVFAKEQNGFDELPVPDVISWSALVAGSA